jgi:hypothetical protein
MIQFEIRYGKTQTMDEKVIHVEENEMVDGRLITKLEAKHKAFLIAKDLRKSNSYVEVSKWRLTGEKGLYLMWVKEIA